MTRDRDEAMWLMRRHDPSLRHGAVVGSTKLGTAEARTLPWRARADGTVT
ncbi:hypothetical protein [Nocardia sp. alder85J]|nr:hypothetical protein [Nocardia sp. alder85J]MCX4091535.1 hypothetical protein [Nocardia sp. alder85J]